MDSIEHLLACLCEECAEVIHRTSKALRFGLAAVQPGQARSNAQRVSEEIVDLLAIVDMLDKLEVISTGNRRTAMADKQTRVLSLMARAGLGGTLADAGGTFGANIDSWTTLIKGTKMNLQLAGAWLDRQHAGFSDIRQFISQCREASALGSRESAAMVLLAERAIAFCERYEGVAVATEIVDRFLAQMREDAHALSEACSGSDASFLASINALAARTAEDLAV
jgi:hypothetical protein